MVVLIHELILFLIMPPFPGIIRVFSPLLVSSSTASGLAVTAIAIAVILLASTVTITNAQQLEQLTSEPSAIQIRTIAENTKDSFRVHRYHRAGQFMT